jgi:hypothetical protein
MAVNCWTFSTWSGWLFIVINIENVQQFTAILQVRQYYINDNEQPTRAGRKCPAVYSHSTGKAVLY